MKKAFPILFALFILCGMSGCSKAKPQPASTPEPQSTSLSTEETIVAEKAPIATITMEDGGEITLELDYASAPNTVKNFIALSNKGFYDGVIFHRVIEGFMIQGGDPTGTGTGGPGYRIKGEFKNNKVANAIKHDRGVISMARQGNPYAPAMAYNTAGSQFFIMHGDSPFLDGDYAAFGTVLTGMDVVDQIATTETDGRDKPLSDQRIKTIRVETFGVEYGQPETITD